jgi:flagellar hook-associated protein 3 FlgL
VQHQLSTGKQINQPSDDPVGTGVALSLQNELSDIQQNQRNINDGVSWLQTSDSALSNVDDTLQRVRELVVQASNGSQDQQSRDATLQEIGQLEGTLRDNANATFDGRYVFSGTLTNTPPYTAASNTYQGNALPVQRLIGSGQTAAVNVDGPTAFGPNGNNVFDLIDQIKADLTSNNQAALGNADLAGIDTSLSTVLQSRSTVGALNNRLNTQLTRLKNQEVNISGLLSDTTDADMAKTMVTYSQTQAIYQSALQAGARIIQPSLLDYLQ